MRVSMQRLMRPLAAVLFAGGLLVSIPANAQNPSPSPGVSEATPSIPDQKLDAAAAALKQVASLKQDYAQRLQAATPAEQERIADEGNNALVKAVTDQGLSVDEYTSILTVAQKDPAVGEKILKRIRPEAK
jgi:hypothetical protein